MGSLAESTSTTFKDNILQSGTESNFKYFMCDKECVSAASSRGMWIEIRKICDRRMVRSRHAPHGARGLKCVLNVVDVHRLGITPLAGRVD